MSRRKSRRPIPALKLHIEPLETRWLLNADGRHPRPEQTAAPLVRSLETPYDSTAAHHLTAFLATQKPAPGTTASATPVVTQPVNTASKPSPGSTPAAPPVVVHDPLAVAIGGNLDVTLPNLGLGNTGLTYTITPQPLPANMTFNRGTGKLVFAPAPAQAGTYDFSVAVSGASGSGMVVLPVTVTNPAVASTEVSGQVVDENGKALAGVPVSIDGTTVTTNQAGDFTLAGVAANPGPISAGGSVGSAQGRLDLTAPVEQLLNHPVYAGANNVIPTPLILPKIDWTAAASFSQSAASQPLDITDPTLPGFAPHPSANAATATSPASGTVSVAELPATLAAQHMPPGVSGPMLLVKITGANLPGAAQVTLPNTDGYAPGSMLSLAALNPRTGGHDILGKLVVSADGKTMTSLGPISLGSATPAGTSGPIVPPGTPIVGSGGNGYVFQFCWIVIPIVWTSQPVTTCDGCQSTILSATNSGNTSAANNGSTPAPKVKEVNSDAGLVTGDYFLDHQLVTYQSQGQENGIDLQYSSAQADPTPVVQYQFTTPPAGDSAAITSVTAQVNLAGVVQGAAATYNTPGGLQDGTTSNIPLQVNASALATGAYSYTMTVTENFGSGSSETSLTSTDQGYVNVVNAASDPLGAGWSVGGLQHLSPSSRPTARY